MAKRTQPELPVSVGVPGDLVTTRLSQHAKLLFLLKRFAQGGYATSGVRRDVVGQVASGQEVYREGPYDEIAFGLQMKRIVEEIRRGVQADNLVHVQH
jgi:hypothetical protein